MIVLEVRDRIETRIERRGCVEISHARLTAYGSRS